MGLFSAAKLFGMTIRESANDGSDFTNPDADYRRLFLGEDGQLHVKDSSGTVTDIGSGSGNVATDAIWDAAGDLAVGSGANTAAKLAIGATNGMAVQRVSGAVAWALPPGYEFDYAQITSPVSITATTEAGANTVVTAGAVSYDGSTIVLVEFFCPYSYTPAAANVDLTFYLYDGSGSIGYLCNHRSESTNRSNQGVYAARRLTPSNASHTYSIRAALSAAGTGEVGAGAGGSGAVVPAFIRTTKV